MSASVPSWLAAAVSAASMMPAWVAGVLAAVAILLVVFDTRRAGAAGLARGVLRLAVAAATILVAFGYLGQMAESERAAERRALEQRAVDLMARALAPGSPLTCLTGDAGDTVETACEKAIFASPESAAAAVAFTAARLSLLADADVLSARGRGAGAALAGLRRSLELDRFGLVAQVLAARDGCNAVECAGLAMLGDASVVKSNLKARAFDGYVERYASAWSTGLTPSAPDKPVESAPQVSGTPALQPATPVAGRYEFPSASSIPPVSIMAAEPTLPGGQAASGAAPRTGEPTAVPPVPPRRPSPPAPQ